MSVAMRRSAVLDQVLAEERQVLVYMSVVMRISAALEQALCEENDMLI